MAKHLGLRARTLHGRFDSRFSAARSLAQVVLGAAMLLATAGILRADPIQIDITGLNLIYNLVDEELFDEGGANSSPFADPDVAGPLVTVDFFENGVLQGSLYANIFADVFIDDMPGAAPPPIGTPFGSTGGVFFHLLADSDDLDVIANNGLLLNLDDFSFHSPVAGVVTGGGDATLNQQSLSFPGFNVMFTSQNLQLALSSASVQTTFEDDVPTGFTWSGTATIFGDGTIEIVPEPSAVTLGVLGAVGLAVGALRRKKPRVLSRIALH